jgi:hypothetical protein
MDLVNYIRENTGIQLGDDYHDSFVRFLSNEKILKLMGIDPPYQAIGFEVKAAKKARKKADLVVFNHELSIIEAKVIRSSNIHTESSRLRDINKQLISDYIYFNKKNLDVKIRLIGAYKHLNEENFNFYNLPSSGLNLNCLEILQIPCK